MFQFLLGRLKTIDPEVAMLGKKQFQFLLGRLKTEELMRYVEVGLSFQFLLGRLKTIFTSSLSINFFSVSIPLRQAKNK